MKNPIQIHVKKPHIFQEFHHVNRLLGIRAIGLPLFKNPTYLELEDFDELSLWNSIRALE